MSEDKREEKVAAEPEATPGAKPAAKPEVSSEDLLARPIRAGGEDKTFGEVTLDDARAMAADLKAKVGWGPTARVATIARGWDDLGRVMNQREAATVADLDGETVIEFAKRVWVLPPYDQMLF